MQEWGTRVERRLTLAKRALGFGGAAAKGGTRVGVAGRRALARTGPAAEETGAKVKTALQSRKYEEDALTPLENKREAVADKASSESASGGGGGGAQLPFMIQNLYLAPLKPAAGPAYTMTRMQPKDAVPFTNLSFHYEHVMLQDVEKPSWAH
eukprot:g1105.t1